MIYYRVHTSQYDRKMQNDMVGAQRSRNVRKVRRYLNFVQPDAAEVRDQTSPVSAGDVPLSFWKCIFVTGALNPVLFNLNLFNASRNRKLRNCS